METRDDADIVLARALLAGKLDVFEEFVHRFRTRIFQYSYLMCGQREDADEVAQDTLLSAFENFATLREPERVRSWIFRIAKNACLMKRRRSIFAPRHELSLERYVQGPSDDGGVRDRQIAAPGEMPDMEAYRGEMNAALTRAIQQLPPNYRSVILLRDIEEIPANDTAEILDISVDVVKQRLHRGRLALKRILDEQFGAHREIAAGRGQNG